MVQAVSRGKEDEGKGAAASYFIQKPAGESIFEAGDQGEEMFVIEDGIVEIVVEGKVIKSLERGDFFGEMSILEDMPRSTGARAGASGECKLLKIDRSMFAEVIRHNPEIAIRIMRGLSHRLRTATVVKREEIKPVVVAAEGKSLAKVVTDSGVTFEVYPKGDTTIGRLDPSTGLRPDIDLRDVDTDRSISRRHAKIIGDGTNYVVVEEVGTSNGTFVNGNRLTTGQKVPIKDGDEVVFGRLKTTFKVG